MWRRSKLDASAQQNDKTLAADIQQMQTDYATEQQDYATEQSDSCAYKGGDAGTVGGDAGTVGGDLGTLQADISSLQSGAMGTIQSDMAAVNSDMATLSNLGASPATDASSALALGRLTLTDSRKAVAWATAKGNQINSAAQQLVNQAQNLANC